MLAYEMLTGALPYAGGTPIQIAFQHVNADIPRPSLVAPELPTEIDDLVATLAARDPDDRPPDAAAALVLVRAALATLDPGALDLRHTTVAAGSPRHDTSTDLRDDEATTTVEGPGTSLDAIPTTAFGEMQPTARAALVTRSGGTKDLDGPPRPRRRRRGRALAWVLTVLLVLGGSGVGAYWWFTDGPGAFTLVPRGLVGESADDAAATLDSVGLAATTTETFSDDVEEGDVVASTPDGGAKVRKDGTVELLVSRGVQMLTVPDGLVGASEDEAVAALREAGFEVADTEREYDDDAAEGTVLSVSVEEGSSQPHDTLIDLVASDGPAPVDVPDVTGSTGDEATAELEDLGLVVSSSEDYSEDVDRGQVVSQSVESGAEAHRGDTVELVVSLGPPLVEVPDVVDQKVEEAEKTLQDAGFTVEINELFGARPLNRVLFQDQDPGTKVPKGTKVKLTVT
ncbi:Stk1 family PASTA domain-containing Ser/Thr kinase [Paraoerskovia sediminicola]|uniref:Stk1 family PASTA domain-containing Ser/Thr kinase n=1 Tax=Paraoerskovia sediminicola TaxID=1138587 RepID=UPI0025728446|nr:Stk1 family PASTA domain-containing Ser/Thr kinase [Paraoerskovia sediminicola]